MLENKRPGFALSQLPPTQNWRLVWRKSLVVVDFHECISVFSDVAVDHVTACVFWATSATRAINDSCTDSSHTDLFNPLSLFCPLLAVPTETIESTQTNFFRQHTNTVNYPQQRIANSQLSLTFLHSVRPSFWGLEIDDACVGYNVIVDTEISFPSWR